MNALLLVGIGGFIGSVARHQLGLVVLQFGAPPRFPWATFAVNVLGCLVVGLLAGVVARSDALGAEARLFLFTGVLGGFTTYSTFGLEAVQLMRRGDWGVAMAYVVASIVLGLAAVWIGLRLVSAWPR